MISNKIKIFNSNNFKDNIKNLTYELNNIFNNNNDDISLLLKEKNINTRIRKITFTDALIYKFKYAERYKTQKNIINDYKLEKNIYCDNTSFFRKEQKIPLEYYDNIFQKVLALFKKYSKKTQYTIIGVDGTYNNTNYNINPKVETSLNMGYFDITNGIPLEIDHIGNKKNTEIQSFISAIKDKKIKEDNVIFVCDRAYFSYGLIKFLNNNNYKYVIRIKNNSKHITNSNNEKNIKNFPKVPDNTRFINYNFLKEYTKDLYNKKTDKKEKYKITQKVNCNIATNLDLTYIDDDIKNIYNSRWSIEEYFKLIKRNFKFSLMREHNKNTSTTYKKTLVIIKIYSVLEKLFELFSDNIINNYNDNYNVKMNKSELINGLFKIIPDIISSNLDYKKLEIFFNIYTCLNFTKKDSHNARVSKIPFTKWYVKDYHANYDIQKIFDVYNNTETKINKNLKSKLKDYIFEQIIE